MFQEARRQSGNNVKIDDLYLNNERLADDRSVAHYNLEDGTILETTSNPFWATCLFIKHCEAEEEQKRNLDNPDVQNWTNKSLARKRTLLSVLFNSKNEFQSQPPHFPTLDDFVGYLNNLKKKGATMNPYYTQRHLGEMFQEYLDLDAGHSSDPLGSFINRYAIKLGFRHLDWNYVEGPQPGELGRNRTINGGGNGGKRTRQPRNNAVANGGKVTCDDCEGTLAELYCGECQNATGGQGLYLCNRCSELIHAGATRRRHNVQDKANAPKISKPYIPHAFKAPFSVLLGLYSGLTEGRPVLSMTEDEIKLRAQPLTDTDLQDKQTGQYCGGFDCMEKILMAKGLVQREDSRNPTYALTETGEELAGQLYEFQQSVHRFLKSNQVPNIPQTINTVCGTRKICLIIDEQERDKNRFHQIALERGVDVQFRQLGAGDYLWILTPPMASPNLRYTHQQPTLEKVLPFLVERKSWEDFKDSVRTKRFHKQVNHMLNSGIEKCFYLMEGSLNNGRYKPSAEQQKNLKDLLEKIFLDNGFYVNYTASWYKSAIWLLWATALASEAQRQGQLTGQGMTYAEFMKQTSGQNRSAVLTRTDFRPMDWKSWEAEHFIDGIFRDSVNEISLIDLCKRDLGPADRHVLNIHDLEAYNKGRQTMLNKCLNEACGSPDRIPDIVNTTLKAQLHNVLHYDVMSWWQLKIQFMLGLYIVRTEKPEERLRIQMEIDWRSGGQPVLNRRTREPWQDPVQRTVGLRQDQNNRLRGPHDRLVTTEQHGDLPSTSSTTEASGDKDLVFASDSQTENFMIQQAVALSKQEEAEEQNSILLSPAKQVAPPSTSNRIPRERPRTASDKKSATATKSREDEELELALKLSLEEAANGGIGDVIPSVNRDMKDPVIDDAESNSINVKQTLIRVHPDLNMDSQEELQYVLELSKKSANITHEGDIPHNNDDFIDVSEPKEQKLSSLSSTTEPERKKHKSANVCESEKGTSKCSEDEDLKLAIELSLKGNQSLMGRRSTTPRSARTSPPSNNQCLSNPVLCPTDLDYTDLDWAIQLGLKSDSDSVPCDVGNVSNQKNVFDVIEIEDSQDLLDGYSDLKRTDREQSCDEENVTYENGSHSESMECIVLDDSQGEPVYNVSQTEKETASIDFITSCNNLKMNPCQLIAEKERETEMSQGCLAPDTQTEEKQILDQGSDVAVPETVLESETLSTFSHYEKSVVEPKPFKFDAATNISDGISNENLDHCYNHADRCQLNARKSNKTLFCNEKYVVHVSNRDTDTGESRNFENDDLDVIPPSPGSRKSKPLTTTFKTSAQDKSFQLSVEEESIEEKCITNTDKIQADENSGKANQDSEGDSQDLFCENLVLPSLSPYNPETETPGKLLPIKTKQTAQPGEDVLHNLVKVKQESTDIMESAVRNEEIVMDSQTLEDSQEELPKYDWMKLSPSHRTDHITVKVMTPVEKGSNLTSDIVKGSSLSLGSTSNININIHIDHIDKTSQSCTKGSLVDEDEEYAKRLQRELNEEYERSKWKTSLIRMETRSIKKEDVCSSPPKSLNGKFSKRHEEDFDDIDAAIAQSLHKELNSPAPKTGRKLLLQDEKIAKQLDKEWNKPNSSGRMSGGAEDEELVTSLQNIETENQEDRDRQIQMDEDLARQLLESDDNGQSTGQKASSVMKRKNFLINDSPPIEKLSRNEAWRKNLFTEDQTARRDSLSQLQQRREQSDSLKERSRSAAGSSSSNRLPWDTVGTSHLDQSGLCNSPMVQDFTRSGDVGTSNWINSTSSSSTCPSKTFSKPPSPSNVDQGEDERPVLGTQSEALSKDRCGNCGEIGHNRKWVKCPQYYSLEESLRRQEQQAKARERTEAREREEAEARQDLGVKVKQESTDIMERNEEIVMDIQALEGSQEELPKYDSVKLSQNRINRITVKVMTPVEKGSNLTSNIVKESHLSKSNININVHIDKTSQSTSKGSLVDEDEEYAKRLQRELDEEYDLQDEKIAKQLDKEWNKPNSSGRMSGGAEDEELVTSLQNIEAEISQEDRDRQIQMDEDLAHRLLELDDNGQSTGQKASSVMKRKNFLINDSPPIEKLSRNEAWRKNLFTEDQTARRDSLSQLQQRREQSDSLKERSRSAAGSSSSNRLPWDTVGTSHLDQSGLCNSPMVQDFTRSGDVGTSNWINSTSSSSTCPSKTFSKPPSPSNVDQGEDERPVLGTQSEALSKDRCGNCGEIGHNRKWVKCPQYYSLEESLRRQEQQAKARERTEAREREETEARQDLENHQRASRNIGIQIDDEIEKTIKRLDRKKKQRENRRK
ncbi:uncharacterized protein LOC125678232 isoform X2 [Ostrea edulis]|uniref:uncharacterized protein LOC125678232 isoform X2 n=1 Tax=Ostrea edulis TaxID=37623 RepID=UPI0024AE9617|nr:uncharacterized protein LOC125678232 isoform X2 [Ostrea edulis]